MAEQRKAKQQQKEDMEWLLWVQERGYLRPEVASYTREPKPIYGPETIDKANERRRYVSNGLKYGWLAREKEMMKEGREKLRPLIRVRGLKNFVN